VENGLVKQMLMVVLSCHFVSFRYYRDAVGRWVAHIFYNQPIFPQLLQVRPVHKSKLFGRNFTDRMPFLPTASEHWRMTVFLTGDSMLPPCCDVVPSTRLRTIGDRAFPAAASRIWNSLPPEITSSRTLLTFKSSLKTYLFSLSFPVV